MRFVVFVMMTLALAQAAEQIDPKIYARLFMNNKPMFDRMSAKVLEKLPKGGKVLDLATGPGEPCITLATMDASAQIVCTDFQPSMIEKAKGRARAAGVTNVGFEVTSADDLSKWNDNSFDAVTMSFGLMFVPEQAKSILEIYRVLKPGGFAYISVWKSLMFQTFTREVIHEIGRHPYGDFEINPLSLKADNAVEALVGPSGLEKVADERMTYSFRMGTPKEAADGCTILAGGILRMWESEGDTGATARFYDAVEKRIKKNGWRDGDEVVIPENSPQLLTLRKPVHQEL